MENEESNSNLMNTPNNLGDKDMGLPSQNVETSNDIGKYEYVMIGGKLQRLLKYDGGKRYKGLGDNEDK
ncbi:MAG: hypothetical protein K9J17_02560 [Flavobacteriales bacterium]|nr:hypothetical protein [Flavobacteriales bacterium]